MVDMPSFENILTKKELDICELISKGQNNSQIAKYLYISEGTVKNCITNILDKTSTSNRAELAVKYTVEYEQAVTDMQVLPSSHNEELGCDFHTHPIARFRLSGDSNLPNLIPLIFMEQTFTIGRFDSNIGHKRCDFEFERTTKTVSRRHAAIEQLAPGTEKKSGGEASFPEAKINEGFVIIDLGSRAGTFLNGEKIPSGRRCLLKHGDQVSFGIAGADYVFVV